MKRKKVGNNQQKKSKVSKSRTTKKIQDTQVTNGYSSNRQNIVALFLLTFGMVFLLSLTTTALGSLGSFLKAVLLGQFSRIGILISLLMLILGVSRLAYGEKFNLKRFTPIMILLSLFASMTFYGAINIAKISEEKISSEILKQVFVQSVVNKNIGIYPYMMTYFLKGFIGRTGMFILSIATFLFIGIYYFKMNFTKFGELGVAMASESKKVASGLKKRTLDYITVDDEDEKSERKMDLEKLDDTAIQDKFAFLERYKNEIDSYQKSKEPIYFDKSGDSEDCFVLPENTDDTPKFLNSVNIESEENESGNEIFKDEISVEQDTFSFNDISIDEEINLEKSVFQDINHIEKDNFIEENTSKENNFELHQLDEVQNEIITPENSQDIGTINLSGFNGDGTRIYFGLGSEIAEVQEAVKSKENIEFIDKRQIHESDKVEKENLSELALPQEFEKQETVRKKYVLPSTSLLKSYKAKGLGKLEQQQDAKKLEETLAIYGIEAKVVNVSVGPTITRYELQLKIGVKVSKILGLSDDLSLALAAVAPIRIEAPIPGTSLIGIEVPNAETDIVGFRAMLESDVFKNTKGHIPVSLGKDVSGKAIIADIAKMPHVLVAGSTGSGKSVCINTLICSILYRSKPEDVKMIMIDPKMVELSVYNEIPHLLIPVVTDMKKAPYALSWAVTEMNKRYKLFADNRVRDLEGYNAINGVEKLPRIIIIVDELADLMMVSPNEVEDSIIRIAQKARACGMHLVIATQRPSVDVITGLIKANIPTRIAFAVSSQVDSRTILDQVGAEKLIGKGDMLFSHPSIAKPQRIQGAFISDEEVNAVADFISGQKYLVEESKSNIIEEEIQSISSAKTEEPDDPLLDEIIEFAIQNKQISTSLVQRRFRIGYNRASRIIDQLEAKGIVSESDGAKPRKVLVSNNEE